MMIHPSSPRRRTVVAGIALILLVVGAFVLWKEAKAPTNEQVNTDPTPTPAATPTPTPTTTPAETKGLVFGRADTKTLHINIINIYDSSGNIVASATPDESGNYQISLDAGNYKIDYEASPDQYPHEPEPVTVYAGETHEVDYLIDSN